MKKNERFGKFVLLEEVDSSGLGAEYRAAKLAGGGALERIVHLVRVAPKLSGNPEFVKSLLEHAKSASLLQGASFVRLLAIGRVEAAYYMAYEYVAGRSLRAILDRSRRDAFPLAPDHALLIASKVCSALEAAGTRKDHGHQAHGLLTPYAVVVTFDGDVKLRGFSSWPAGIHKAGGVSAAESAYLAPEQQKTGKADARADAYSVGVLLFEMLTGEPFRGGSAGEDTARRVRGARLHGGGDAEQLSKPIAEIVSRTAATDPAARFADIGALRKAIDTLLFSGGFSPTTFNLAFFMNSLFRDEIEREAGIVAEEASAGYAEYAEEPPAPAAAAAPTPAPKPAPPAPPVVAAAPPPPVEAAEPKAEIQIVPREEPRPPALVRARETPAAPTPAPVPVPHRDTVPPLMLRQESQKGAPVAAIVGGLVLLAGGVGWYFLAGPGAKKPAPPPPSTLSAEAAAALARVRELEGKLKKFEQEKAEAEAKAVDEAKKKVEAQAAAKGQTVDPAALQKAQEDARRKSQAEQERRQQEQRQRLEAEKQAEETRLAEERRRAEAAAAAAATPVPTTVAAAPSTTVPAPTPPPTTAAPPPTTLAEAAVKPGALVNLADANVIPPVGIKQERPAYPPIAFQQRAEGRIELQALIDDKGNVTDVKLVKGTTGIGLNQAALDGVRRWRYRPATKDGVPVKVWMPIVIEFKAPPR